MSVAHVSCTHVSQAVPLAHLMCRVLVCNVSQAVSVARLSLNSRDMDLLALPHVGPAADAAPASTNVVHRLRLLVERHGILPSVPVPAPARPPLST